MENIKAVLNRLDIETKDKNQLINMIDYLLITTDEDAFQTGYKEGKAEICEIEACDDCFTAEDMERQFDLGFTEGQNAMLNTRQIERLKEIDQRVWGSHRGWEE